MCTDKDEIKYDNNHVDITIIVVATKPQSICNQSILWKKKKIMKTYIWVTIIARTPTGRAHYNFNIIRRRPAHWSQWWWWGWGLSSEYIIRLRWMENCLCMYVAWINLVWFAQWRKAKIYLVWSGEKPSIGVETPAAAIITVVWVLCQICWQLNWYIFKRKFSLFLLDYGEDTKLWFAANINQYCIWLCTLCCWWYQFLCLCPWINS